MLTWTGPTRAGISKAEQFKTLPSIVYLFLIRASLFVVRSPQNNACFSLFSWVTGHIFFLFTELLKPGLFFAKSIDLHLSQVRFHHFPSLIVIENYPFWRCNTSFCFCLSIKQSRLKQDQGLFSDATVTTSSASKRIPRTTLIWNKRLRRSTTVLYSHRHHRHRHVRSFHNCSETVKHRLTRKATRTHGVPRVMLRTLTTPDDCRQSANCIRCSKGRGVFLVALNHMIFRNCLWALPATGWTFLQTTFMARRQLYGSSFKTVRRTFTFDFITSKLGCCQHAKLPLTLSK